MLGRDFRPGPRLKLNIEAGYGIRLKDNIYVIKNGKVLTDKSKDVLDIVSPGGIIWGFEIGVGF